MVLSTNNSKLINCNHKKKHIEKEIQIIARMFTKDTKTFVYIFAIPFQFHYSVKSLPVFLDSLSS